MKTKEGDIVIEKDDLFRVKKSLDSIVGQKVQLTAKKGRKKSVTRHGVIESTYPNIFVVKLDSTATSTRTERRVSYSYTDILTKTVELVVCKNNKTVQCN